MIALKVFEDESEYKPSNIWQHKKLTIKNKGINMIIDKIKRIIRECYRINKNILIENKQDLTIAIIYLSSEIPEFRLLEEKIKLVLQRLNQGL